MTIEVAASLDAWGDESLFGRAGFRLLTEFTDVLRGAVASCGWDEAEQSTIWAMYELSGRSRNGWNAVLGHLFFTRDAAPADLTELDSH